MKIKYRIHSAGEINALTSDKPLPECANSHLLPSCGAFSSPWIVGGNAQAVGKKGQGSLMGEDSLLERVTATAEDLETNFLHERTRQR